MRLCDEGFVIGFSPFQDSLDIAQVFCRVNGVLRGVYRRDKRSQPPQPGTLVEAQWTARLFEHLGRITLEPKTPAPLLHQDRLGLLALSSACGLIHDLIPERHPYTVLYEAFADLVDALREAGTARASAYLRFELALLSGIGFGLDLTQCALSGARDDLRYISPRTGRAVSQAAGQPYKNKLLFLHDELLNPEVAGDNWALIYQPMIVINSFLIKHGYKYQVQRGYAARQRLVHYIEKMGNTASLTA